MKLPTTDVTDFANQPGQGPLRPGGQGAPRDSVMPSDSRNLPSTPSPAVVRQMPALRLVRDVVAGNETVKNAGRTYLPQAPREDPADYKVRLDRAVLFNVLRNTITGLTGFIFRTDPKLGEDVPAQIVADWENIDLAGTHGDVFARDIEADAMTAGHAAILVEYPNTSTIPLPRLSDGRVSGIADQVLRPYWVPIKKDNIVSWRTTVENGITLLVQLVVRETGLVADGEFGEKEDTLYRVFQRVNGVVSWSLYAITGNKRLILMDAGTYPTQEEIPVAEIVTSGRVAMFDSDPPFYDLACLNLAHYRQWSDYDTSIHKTCVPLLFTAGFIMQDAQGQPIVVSANSGLNSPDPNGKAEYVTHGGEALGQCKASLDDLEQRMAALGLAALASQKRVAETAKAKEIDKGATDSALAVNARGLEDGLERAFGFHARYYGLPSGGSVEVNKDFENMVMDSATMGAWASLATALSLPVRVVIEALIEGKQLPDTTDVDALEAEILANQAAEQERKAQEMKDQATLAQARGPKVATV